MKRLVIALMAFLLAVLGSPAAYAGEAGGSTGASGGGIGGGSSGVSVGGGATPGAAGWPPGVTGQEIASASTYAEWWSYENRANCPAYANPHTGGTNMNFQYHFKKQWVNGTYRDVLYDSGCVAQPVIEVEIRQKKCVVRNTITVERLTTPAGTLGGTPKTKSTPWATKKNWDACEASQSSRLSVSVPISEPGQYRAKGESRVDIMTYKYYPNNEREPEYVSHKLFDEDRDDFKTNYTMTCEVYTIGDKAWIVGKLVPWQNLPSCMTPNNTPGSPATPPGGSTPTVKPPTVTDSSQVITVNGPNYMCQIPNDATLDGKSNPIVDIMRNGKESVLQWKTPKIVGTNGTTISSSKVNKTKFEVWDAPESNGGTWKGNTFELKNGNTQLFSGKYTENGHGMGTSNTTTGALTKVNLKAFQSTARNKPMTITPVYEYTGRVKFNTVEITNIDLDGKITMKTVTAYKDETFSCRGDTITTNVMKTMNDQL